MLRYLFIIPLFLSVWAFGQLKISGKILHHVSQKKLPLCQINIIDSDTNEKRSVMSSSGNYKIKLERDKKYHIEYAKDGYYSKILSIDTRGIPSNKSTSMSVEMDMINKEQGISEQVFLEPVGKCWYDPQRRQMKWDVAYSKVMFEKMSMAFEKMNKPASQNNTVEDEPTLFKPVNPFKRTEVLHTSLGKNYAIHPKEGVLAWKRSLKLGLELGGLALNANSNDQTLFIKSLYSLQSEANRELGNKEDALDFRSNSQLIAKHLEGNRDSVNYALNHAYLQLSALTKKSSTLNHYYYMNVGALLEIIFQVTQQYLTFSTPILNKFLGEIHQAVLNYNNVWDTSISTDGELSFQTELQKLGKFLEQIKPALPGEQLQSDKPHYPYIITRVNLSEILDAVRGIRSNLL